MAVEIKKVAVPDIPRLVQAAHDIWIEHYTPIIGAEQVEYMLRTLQSAERIELDIAQAGFTYLMAQDENDIVGYCAIVPSEDALFLSKLYINREYRGKGIARKFLDLVFESARKQSLSCIRLTVNKSNTSSIAAYEHLGFDIEASAVTDIGEGYVMDDFVMVLELDQE